MIKDFIFGSNNARKMYELSFESNLATACLLLGILFIILLVVVITKLYNDHKTIKNLQITKNIIKENLVITEQERNILKIVKENPEKAEMIIKLIK